MRDQETKVVIGGLRVNKKKVADKNIQNYPACNNLTIAITLFGGLYFQTFASKQVSIDSTPNNLTGGPLSQYDSNTGTLRSRKVIKTAMK